MALFAGPGPGFLRAYENIYRGLTDYVACVPDREMPGVRSIQDRRPITSFTIAVKSLRISANFSLLLL